jgi:thioredoxin 1
MTQELNEANFSTEVLESDVPVLVDFWSPTCGPCRQLAPVIDKLATANEGTAKVVKVDVSSNMGLAEKFNVQYLPTIMVFKGGEVVGTQVGVAPPEKLQKMIDSAA